MQSAAIRVGSSRWLAVTGIVALGLLITACAETGYASPATAGATPSATVAIPVAGSGAKSADIKGDPNVISHHWQSLRALKGGDSNEALHHVRHIIDLVSGDHRAQMEIVVIEIESGRLHQAEHMIESMLSDVADPGLSSRQMHLQLALYSLETEEIQKAVHHLEHYRQDGGDSGGQSVEAILSSLRTDQRMSAELQISRLLEGLIDEDLAFVQCRRDREARLGPSRHTIRAEVVTDLEWTTSHGEDADERLQSVILEAAAALSVIGVNLDVIDYRAWQSPESPDLDSLSHAAQLQLPGNEAGNLRILLTGRPIPGTSDGHYSDDDRTVVVRHKHANHSVEPWVLVHEIGHFLGLAHRRGTFMQPHGFPLVPGWSECQKFPAAG